MLSRRLIGISLGYFMVLLDATILNVALPDLARDLGGSIAAQQWAINAYLVAFGALLLSSGAIADRFGAARVFVFGIAAFAVTSVLCAVAPTLGLLIAFRVLQGASAAAVPSATLALLGAMYPDAKARARAVGHWAALTGLGFAAGPLLGGVLVDLGGWRMVFLVNLPAALAGLLLARGLDVEIPRRAARLDLRGQLAAIVTFALLIDTVIQIPSGDELVPAVLTVIAAALLVVSERHSAAPAFPPVLLRVRDVRWSLGLGVAVQFQMIGGLFVLGLYFLNARHYGPMRTGFAFIPMTTGPLFGPLAARLVGRAGPRRTIRFGLLVSIAGNLLTSAAVLAGLPFPVIVLTLFFMGIGMPFTLVPLTAQLVGAAPVGSGGVAGGLFNAVRQIGGALGVAVLGGLVAARGPGDGAGYALAASAAVIAIAFVAQLVSDISHGKAMIADTAVAVPAPVPSKS
jgi:DHA2 family methylenomycin A resistance protein-like MFS transporter